MLGKMHRSPSEEPREVKFLCRDPEVGKRVSPAGNLTTDQQSGSMMGKKAVTLGKTKEAGEG